MKLGKGLMLGNCELVLEDGDFTADSNVSNVSLSQLSSLTRTSRPDITSRWRRLWLVAAALAVAGYFVYQGRLKTTASANGKLRVDAAVAPAPPVAPVASSERRAPRKKTIVDTAQRPPKNLPPLIRLDDLEPESPKEPGPRRPKRRRH